MVFMNLHRYAKGPEYWEPQIEIMGLGAETEWFMYCVACCTTVQLALVDLASRSACLPFPTTWSCM